MATALLALSCLIKEGNMGQWLVADLSVMDVHFQLWMVLVTAILLVWFAFVWATRHVR